MIEIGEALDRLLGDVRPLPAIEVPLEDAAGRVLAEDVFADRDLPPAATSTMDGFALRAADVPAPGTTLQIVGEVRAGQAPPTTPLGPNEALRILTGALLPPGSDTVVMVELTREHPSSGEVEILERPSSGQNIRTRGEDVRAGDRILETGSVVHAPEIAALAAVGKVRVLVVRPPVVHVLATGDEVVETDRTPLPHQVRNSNARALVAQLGELGLRGEVLGIAPDGREELLSTLGRGLAGDVLVVTGGVSVGTYDLVADALARAGTRVLFHGVAIRPGKPILAGRAGACLVLALPGNPVSAFTTFAVFGAPALRKMMGLRRFENLEVRAVLGARLKRRPDRTTYHLARLVVVDGRIVAHPVRTMGSGDVVSLASANGFVVTTAATDALAPGAEVVALPWTDFHLR